MQQPGQQQQQQAPPMNYSAAGSNGGGKGATNASNNTTPSSTKNKKKGSRDDVPRFVIKTYEMMMNPSHRDLVDWNREGTAIVIKNVHGFSEKVLPQYFKHSNYTSFIRQLNMYGFTRALNLPQAFKHPLFQRGKQENLPLLKRKQSQPRQDLAALSNKHKAELERALQDIKALREQQKRFDDEVSKLKGQNNHLDKENSMLWKAVDEARDRQQLLAQKMQQIMAFLYGVFMNKDGKAQLESISEALPMILNSAKEAGVEIEEIKEGNYPTDARELLGSSSSSETSAVQPPSAQHPRYESHRPHVSSMPKTAHASGSAPASSSSSSSALVPSSASGATAATLGQAPAAATGGAIGAQRQPTVDFGSDDLLRLDSSLSRMPSLGGDMLLNYDPHNPPTVSPTNQANSFESARTGGGSAYPPATDVSKLDSIASFGLLKDLETPDADRSAHQHNGQGSSNSGNGGGAQDLARADSLVRGSSLQSFLDLVETNKANNGYVNDDIHKHLDIAKELDQYMTDQDNTLQRMNTIESQLSLAHGPHDGDGDFDDYESNHEGNNGDGDDDYGFDGGVDEAGPSNLSPSKRNAPDSSTAEADALSQSAKRRRNSVEGP